MTRTFVINGHSVVAEANPLGDTFHAILNQSPLATQWPHVYIQVGAAHTYGCGSGINGARTGVCDCGAMTLLSQALQLADPSHV